MQSHIVLSFGWDKGQVIVERGIERQTYNDRQIQRQIKRQSRIDRHRDSDKDRDKK